MKYRELQSRNQGFLFNNIEDWVSEDNPVRLIDLLIDKLYQSDPDKFSVNKPTSNDATGRKAYPPYLFAKLYLYGYLNRINSSRRLEAECSRNIEVMWLMNNERPDFKTISNYRKDNGDAIRWCSRSFKTFLRDTGYIKNEKVAYDGCKIKACTAKEGYTLEGVTRRMSNLEKDLETYLSLLEKTDGEEDLAEEAIQRESSLMERISSLEKQLHSLEEYKRKMEAESRTSYFPNDPKAILLKGRYGSYPGYNLQAGMDAANHMVVSAKVTTSSNDWNELSANVESTGKEVGSVPEVVLADKGYANIQEIEAVQSQEGVSEVIVPLQESERQKKDRLNHLHFTYDKDTDTVVCPKGKVMELKQSNYVNRHGSHYRRYAARKVHCNNCSLKEVCNGSSKNGRNYYISHNSFLESYKEKSKTKEFKNQAAERKNIIEHLFGTFRMWMGKIPLLLKGRQKVQTEIDIYATAYNLKRLLNLEPVTVTLEKLKDYNFA
ncbi:IS1182 family transposase [Parabacteroides faecis]|uniref:IS1182 family transposase n=1 Tax=Parabacteroides faecis TaxID=1217282 RepID=UPI00216493D9|nr:IS1182 family transposase [Parabacteroides faecis]MCS2891801.1 IS1182 family transposase [Parabacteroides faecis]UVQ44587.1 IS1182 family transposase [Parabacteroides faecis]